MNAQLTDAAPDLLAALEMAAGVLLSDARTGTAGIAAQQRSKALVASLAAIAKATGR